ncbi:sugar kinase [Ferdinandcohnia sp. SAFN-114]|uniref:sugar kinase n=1 Tax=Ferdinandcohnia sp. SAFN-114 TaxID=3387275 RepID=UPI003F7CEF14
MSEKPRVVTLGETMAVFQTPQDGRIEYTPSLIKTLAGAESNVAIGLTRLGIKTKWVSRLGMDPFGKYIQSTLKGEDVEVRVSIDKKSPTGIMFKEINGEQDPNVYYYRQHSAASKWAENDITEEIFQDAELFHFTGITPALSPESKNAIFQAITLAKRQGLKISFDPNMRYKLWSEEEAKETFLQLVCLSDIVLPGLDEGELITGETDPDKIAAKMLDLGPSCVVLKLGAEGAVSYTRSNEGHISKIYEEGIKVERVIDSVGAGDGFAAGFLSAYLENLELRECLKRANAVGALVTQYRGDWENLATIEQLNMYMAGRTSKSR